MNLKNRFAKFGAPLLASVSIVFAVSCGTSGSSVFSGGGNDAGGTKYNDAGIPLDDAGNPIFVLGDSGILTDAGGAVTAISILPAAPQTLTVTIGASPVNTLTVRAVTSTGSPIAPNWSVDLPTIATISSSGVLTPNGTVGGTVTVTASYGSLRATLPVLVALVGNQNGPTTAELLPDAGSGGFGGVGGGGMGTVVSNTALLTALQAGPTATGSTQGLTLLYPYDQTVWPRGLLAPLIQWYWSLNTASGVALSLVASDGSFSWTGTFAPPAGATSYINQPIPQDIWAMATNTVSGTVTLKMTLAVASGTTVYGPLTATWTIAPALLSGTVYYNSYGTQLATNSGPSILDSYNNQFGAAVLSISTGATGPSVVAGLNTAFDSGCRVCHGVAGGGGTLIAQWANDSTTSWYNLKNGNAETPKRQ